MSTAKTTEERERLLELVETAMLRGSFRVVDILRVVPDIKSRITAREYMDVIGERWAGRQSDNELERHRLIDEKREIIRQAYGMIDECDRMLMDADTLATAPERAAARTDANTNRAKAMKLILEAQGGIAKLLGLEVSKVEHSGSITEERNSTIAILTASAESHSVRGILCGIGNSSQERDRALPTQPDAVALPRGEDCSSDQERPAEVPPPQA